MLVNVLIQLAKIIGIVIVCLIMLVLIPVLSVVLGIVDHLTGEKEHGRD